MSKWRDIRIHVPTSKISEAVQKKLFEDGCKWMAGEAEVGYTDKHYLYVNKQGQVTHGDCQSYFTLNSYRREVPYRKILKDSIMKCTKEDLIPGKHIVRTSDDRWYTVMSNGVLLRWRAMSGWISLDLYADDMSCPGNPAATVQKVFVIPADWDGGPEELVLVWRRGPEVKEITIAELEKMYGMKVKVVGDE